MARTEELEQALSARAVALLERAGSTPAARNGWVPVPPHGWSRYAAPPGVPDAAPPDVAVRGDGHAGAAHRGEWADGIGCLRPE